MCAASYLLFANFNLATMGLDFYHHICNTCLSVPVDLQGRSSKFQSCSGCKLVSYCCRSHQKLDWREHKSFCTQVQKLLQARQCTTLFSSLEEPTHQSLYDYQSNLTEIFEKQLNRRLTFCERSMIFFPDICGMCLKPNGTDFVCCGKCRLQFYCCYDDLVKHSEKHEKDCDSLKLCFELFNFLSFNLDHPPSRVCQKVLMPPIEFPLTLDDYFSTYTEIDNISIFDKVIFSDILSYLLTLVYAIRRSTELGDKSSLCIHVLGATQIESYVLTILDTFFVWMDSLEHLELVFVGPDCPPPDENFIQSITEKHPDKNLSISFHSGLLYHELFSHCQQLLKPDVLVAFNCGFHEFKGHNCDTWEETIDFILELRNVILITTSYTYKEAQEDSIPFVSERNRVNVLKLCERNPFKSLNPHRNPERSESSIFFFNQFLSVFSIN